MPMTLSGLAPGSEAGVCLLGADIYYLYKGYDGG
ncbi:hypothetical protein J2790_001401 [Paenarthrobacter nicotinovorans]|nr:hypothetical protein [Paenarthrobacter nicotinovorans]